MADIFSPSERSRIMAAVKGKNTSPELIVRRMAHRLGFRFRLHVKGLPVPAWLEKVPQVPDVAETVPA